MLRDARQKIPIFMNIQMLYQGLNKVPTKQGDYIPRLTFLS